jgi:hypothetical protein
MGKHQDSDASKRAQAEAVKAAQQARKREQDAERAQGAQRITDYDRRKREGR